MSRLRPASWAGAHPAEIGSYLFWPAIPHLESSPVLAEAGESNPRTPPARWVGCAELSRRSVAGWPADVPGAVNASLE